MIVIIEKLDGDLGMKLQSQDGMIELIESRKLADGARAVTRRVVALLDSLSCAAASDEGLSLIMGGGVWAVKCDAVEANAALEVLWGVWTAHRAPRPAQVEVFNGVTVNLSGADGERLAELTGAAIAAKLTEAAEAELSELSAAGEPLPLDPPKVGFVEAVWDGKMSEAAWERSFEARDMSGGRPGGLQYIANALPEAEPILDAARKIIGFRLHRSNLDDLMMLAMSCGACFTIKDE